MTEAETQDLLIGVVQALAILRDENKHDELAREQAEDALCAALCFDCSEGWDLAPPSFTRHMVPGSDGAVRECLALVRRCVTCYGPVMDCTHPEPEGCE
jgi:hypothetical protein